MIEKIIVINELAEEKFNDLVRGMKGLPSSRRHINRYLKFYVNVMSVHFRVLPLFM